MDFLSTLFDFSFDRFVTTKIIKILYGLLILLAGLGALVVIVAAFNEGVGVGIFALIASPIIFGLYVIAGRVWLELVIVIFRIAENVAEIAKKHETTY